MCQRTVCRKCQKFTYRGCGMHVEQVLAGIPDAQRCTCAKNAKDAKNAKNAASSGSLWKRLLGRS